MDKKRPRQSPSPSRQVKVRLDVPDVILPDLPPEMWSVIASCVYADETEDVYFRSLARVSKTWCSFVQESITHVTLNFIQTKPYMVWHSLNFGQYPRLSSLTIRLDSMNNFPLLARQVTEKIDMLWIDYVPHRETKMRPCIPSMLGYTRLRVLRCPGLFYQCHNVDLECQHLPVTLEMLEFEAWRTISRLDHLTNLHTLYVHSHICCINSLPVSLRNLTLHYREESRDSALVLDNGRFISHYDPDKRIQECLHLEEVVLVNVPIKVGPIDVSWIFPNVHAVNLINCHMGKRSRVAFYAQFPNLRTRTEKTIEWKGSRMQRNQPLSMHAMLKQEE